MKPPFFISLLSAVLLCSLMLLTSCATSRCPVLKALAFSGPELSVLADRALTAAVITGRIRPAEAELLREGGALILDASHRQQLPVQRLSQLVIKTAVQQGALKPAEAELLLAEPLVPLTPAD